MQHSLLRGFCIILLKLLFRLKVEGLENLPKKTNFILAANHSSFIDPLAVTAAVPTKIYWITLREIHGASLFKWVALHKGTLPTGNASENAAALLMKNLNVGLFPEGTRSFDGQLGEFKRGAALLALRTGRPVVPCAILGAHEAFPRTAKFPKFSRIKVRIGPPLYLLKEYGDVIDDVGLQEGTFKIRNAIKEMLYAGE